MSSRVKGVSDPFIVLGWVAVVIVAFDIFANWGDWTELLWFCTVTTSLLAYALFRKNALIMTVCLVMALPAQSMWVIDFVLEMFGMGMGRTAMLEPCGPLIFWGSAVIHTFMIPVSYWGVRQLGFSRAALGWALFYGISLLVLSFVLTPEFKNVNCVFFHCDRDDPGGGYLRYFLTRSLFLWVMIVIGSYFVLRWLFRDGAARGGANADNT